jgi:exodeoxyribonuclease VII large subunit
LGPESILSRGFSFTMTADGRSLQNADQVHAGDMLVTRLQHGQVTSVVKD